MKNSAPCKSSARRSELVRLFWKAQVMQGFRDGRGNEFIIPERWDSKRLAEWLFSDIISAAYPEDTHPTVHFTFDGHWFGDELWLAVVAEGMIIVPPFKRPLKCADIPLFPEELACSASR